MEAMIDASGLAALQDELLASRNAIAVLEQSLATERQQRGMTKDQVFEIVAQMAKTIKGKGIVIERLRAAVREAEETRDDQSQKVKTLEQALKAASKRAQNTGLMVRASEAKAMMLGERLSKIEPRGIRLETLVTAMQNSRSWRATRLWRVLERFMTRCFLHRRSRRLLKRHFDTGWFSSQYPEMVGLEVDPFAYYMDHGIAQDLDPNPCFDMRWYLRRYPDIRRVGVHPLLHFRLHGFDEGRSPHPKVTRAQYQNWCERARSLR